MAGLDPDIIRKVALRQVAYELGFHDDVGNAILWVEGLAVELGRLGLTWDNVPEKFDPTKALAATEMGRIALDLARHDEGFLLFEAIVQQPGSRRDEVLAAYEQCLSVLPLPIEPEQN